MNKKLGVMFASILISALFVVSTAFAQDLPYPKRKPLPTGEHDVPEEDDGHSCGAQYFEDVHHTVQYYGAKIEIHSGFLKTIEHTECHDGTRTCRDAFSDYTEKLMNYRGRYVHEFGTMHTVPNSPICPEQEVYVNSSYDRAMKSMKVDSNCAWFSRDYHRSPGAFLAPKLLGESTEQEPTVDGLATSTIYKKAKFRDRLTIEIDPFSFKRDGCGFEAIVDIPFDVNTSVENFQCSDFSVNKVAAEGERGLCFVSLPIEGSDALILTPKVAIDGLFRIQWGNPTVHPKELRPPQLFYPSEG